MVEIADVVLRSAEAVGPVDNELRFVVQSFDGAVVDGHPEVVEDAHRQRHRRRTEQQRA